MTYNFDNSVLREYDIRGIIGETLAAEDAYNIGRAFASFKPIWQQKAPTIAVGRDGRVSSVMLEEALIKGLRESGANVVSIGLVATPMLYFTVAQGIDAGVMITGSHNPPSHNGFKFMIAGESFYGKDIKKIGEIAAKGAYFSGNGALTHKNIEEDYLAAILKSYTNKRPLKVVWDCGNGATGEIVEKLVKHIEGENITLFTQIDGSFPNHHPDPSVAKNLQDVIAKVREHQCDIGIAFDGDGDRIGVVDQNGEIIAGD
ncbi:MAG: phosphomannomutase, partial [Pseudomonadota bacterium]